MFCHHINSRSRFVRIYISAIHTVFKIKMWQFRLEKKNMFLTLFLYNNFRILFSFESDIDNMTTYYLHFTNSSLIVLPNPQLLTFNPKHNDITTYSPPARSYVSTLAPRTSRARAAVGSRRQRVARRPITSLN